MAGLTFKHIYKVYPNGTKAVNDFNMTVEDKEFIVFVGPSGCGKSTTLRMVAGLEDISAGELTIGDLVVNDVEPKDRDIAMVFQNYALYPHMTVYDNIAFGLRLRRVPRDEKHRNGKMTRDEIHAKVTEAAEILGITEYLGKKPKEMSGGQRQRVSLGRAIVREPKVMLLDEPLSNLDAKLRTQMRAEISKLHAKLNTTFIYVTHDQVEAMTMGTRIVVMKDGYVQQIDTPKNLYNYPGNKFVAGFIGTPQMNFLTGYLKKQGESVIISIDGSDAAIKVPYEKMYKVQPAYLNGDKKVCIGLRAEDISIDPEKTANADALIKVKVSHKEELGNQTLIYGDISMDGDGYTENGTRVILQSDEAEVNSGDIVVAALNIDKIHLFDIETEKSILPRLPEFNYLDCTVKGGKILVEGVEIALPPAIVCADGEYELLIPTDAVKFCGDIGAEVVANEKVDNKTLVSVALGKKRIFAVTDGEVPCGKLNISFDLKKITLLQNGQTAVAAMPETICMEGFMFKEKIVEETSSPVEATPAGMGTLFESGQPTEEVTAVKTIKAKKVKRIEFFLNIGGAVFAAPDDISAKLISAMGVKKAFGGKLRFECSPYDLKFTKDGIPAEVTGIADYGSERFAVCTVCGNTAYVRCDGEVTGSVCLTPDIGSLAVIQADMDIRIV